MFEILLSLFIEPKIEYVEPIAIEVPSEPLVSTVEQLDSCFCVRIASQHSKFDIPRQNAEDFIPNSTPLIGGLILLQYGDVHHVSVITGFTEEGFEVIEGNFKPCETTKRVISYNDKFIKGFWSEKP